MFLYEKSFSQEMQQCCLHVADANECPARVQVSMSSTSIVVKCLTDSKSTGSPHGQITIGTLILQVRATAHPLPQHSFLPSADPGCVFVMPPLLPLHVMRVEVHLLV